MLEYPVQAKDACALEDLQFNYSFQTRDVAKMRMPVLHTYKTTSCL